MATKIVLISFIIVALSLGACASSAPQIKGVPASLCKQEWMGDFDIEEHPDGKILFKLHGVTDLDGNTPAEVAGVRTGDVIKLEVPGYMRGHYEAIAWSYQSARVLVREKNPNGCWILINPRILEPRVCYLNRRCTTRFRTIEGRAATEEFGGPDCAKGLPPLDLDDDEEEPEPSEETSNKPDMKVRMQLPKKPEEAPKLKIKIK